MRKNYVVFSPTSGRGISKTKALSDYLSLAYVVVLWHGHVGSSKGVFLLRKLRIFVLRKYIVRFGGKHGAIDA